MSTRFDILTIFPHMFDLYLNESMMKQARARGILDVRVHDLREYAPDREHRKVDDRPYGGGPGMVLKIEPIARAIGSILRISNFQFPISKQKKIKIVLFSAAGKQFTQKMAGDWAKRHDHIVMIAGHYEGVDERVKKVIKDMTSIRVEEICIGPYTLTGGELPAMVMVDAVSRHLPGFLGKSESLEETRYGVGLPAYTRPAEFKWKGKIYRVPNVLLSGNHKRIEEWRKDHNF